MNKWFAKFEKFRAEFDEAYNPTATCCPRCHQHIPYPKVERWEYQAVLPVKSCPACGLAFRFNAQSRAAVEENPPGPSQRPTDFPLDVRYDGDQLFVNFPHGYASVESLSRLFQYFFYNCGCAILFFGVATYWPHHPKLEFLPLILTLGFLPVICLTLYKIFRQLYGTDLLVVNSRGASLIKALGPLVLRRRIAASEIQLVRRTVCTYYRVGVRFIWIYGVQIWGTRKNLEMGLSMEKEHQLYLRNLLIGHIVKYVDSPYQQWATGRLLKKSDAPVTPGCSGGSDGGSGSYWSRPVDQ